MTVASDTQEYVYRYAVIAGEDAWKWQQKGTLVWAQAKTEQDAIKTIEADARNRGVTAQITDVSTIRSRSDHREEQTAAPQFWQIPEGSQALNPERKNERSQQREQQQGRDGLGFSF